MILTVIVLVYFQNSRQEVNSDGGRPGPAMRVKHVRLTNTAIRAAFPLCSDLVELQKSLTCTGKPCIIILILGTFVCSIGGRTAFYKICVPAPYPLNILYSQHT